MVTRRSVQVGALVGCSLAAFAACSSEGSGSPGSSVGAPGTTPASDLEPQDVAALCARYGDAVPGATASCRYTAITTTVRRDEGSVEERRGWCASSESGCLERWDEGVAQLEQLCAQAWLGPTCGATVAQLEACFADFGAAFRGMYSSLPGSCATADLTAPRDTLPRPTTPESCLTALAACPTLFQTASVGTDPEPPPPSVALCEETCSAFVAACGLPECPDFCEIGVSVFGEACEPYAERFYACARTATFDCTEESTLGAVDGCAEERADYMACWALDGPTCAAEDALDDTCRRRDPALPFARRCVSDAAPTECERYLSGYYCCPTAG